MPTALLLRETRISRTGYAGVVIEFAGERLCIDPSEYMENCSYILCTHPHDRHCRGVETSIIIFTSTKSKRSVLPGDAFQLGVFRVFSTQAYNDPEVYESTPPHPKGSGVGFIVETPSKLRVYYVGDSNLVPEVAESASNSDIIIVPIGGGCVMTPEEASELVKHSRPLVAIPVHYDAPVFFARFKDIAQPYTQVIQLRPPNTKFKVF